MKRLHIKTDAIAIYFYSTGVEKYITSHSSPKIEKYKVIQVRKDGVFYKHKSLFYNFHPFFLALLL